MPMTSIPFTPVRTARLSEEIVLQIARLVEDGSLRLDDRFPSERDLQERWQVSRPVLREAFRILETQGVVESRPGAGRYLRSEHIPSPTRIRRARINVDREHLLRVWDAREAVESKAAALAAVRATPPQLADMAAALEPLEAASFEDLQRYDFNREFHLSVARAAGNPLLLEIISGLISRSSQIGFKQALEREDWADLTGRHEPIYEAIVARDAEAARLAMVAHFDAMRRNIGVS
jgi:GntR family transcriptional regulator, transcriptional repressor for pyruvate dehydrogenase complex